MTRSAQRSAHGNFFLASGGASHQQVGDVGASNEQNESNSAEQEPQSGAHVAVQEVILQRLDGSAPTFVRFRINIRHVASDRAHIRIGLRQGDAGLHAREDHEKMKIVINLVRFEDQRNEKIRGGPVGLSSGTNADHRVDFAVHVDFTADDVGITAEMFAPHSIGKNDNVIFSGHGFVRAEVTAKEWSFAKQLIQKTRSGETAADAFGLFADGEVEIGIGGGAHKLENGVLALPFEEITGGRDVSISSNGGADDDELVGVRIRERSEQRSVNDAEDGGVGTDSQSEREHRDSGESGILQEQAESIAGVTQQVHHAGPLRSWNRDKARTLIRFEPVRSHESVVSWHVERQSNCCAKL